VDSGKKGITLSAEARDRLQQHFFPGNVRELENVMQRIVSGTGNNRVISSDELAETLVSTHSPSPPHPVQRTGQGMSLPQGAESAAVSLAELPDILVGARIGMNDPALAGAKPRLEAAFKELLKRLAGAALERCRDPVTGMLNRQRAMQLLTGDSTLKGNGPVRVINDILGRKQESKITEEDLDHLVQLWKGQQDNS